MRGIVKRLGISLGMPAVVLLCAGVLILAFWGFNWYSYDSLRREYWAQSAAQAERVRLAFAAHVTRLLDYGDSFLRAVRHDFYENPDRVSLLNHIDEIETLRARSFAGQILVMDAQGRMIFHSGDVSFTDVNIADLPFFQALRADPRDRLLIDPTRVGRATGLLQFRLVRPLLRDGRFDGVMMLTMRPEELTDFYRDLNVGDHAAFMLLTQDCRVIARAPAAKDSDFAAAIPGLAVWRGHDLEREPTGSLHQLSVIDGIARTFYYARLEGYPLVVSLGIADDDVEEALVEPARNLALLGVAFTVTIAVVALLLAAFMRANRKLSRAGEATRLINERLRRSNELLERSNADLERFAYVASHDLQTPLRNMTSFAQLLDQRYRPQLDDDGREFLGFIVAGARQMSAQISDLLEYSRVSSQGQPLAPVAAGQAVSAALSMLEAAIHKSGARIEVAELPTILADGGQLGRLFLNLIENALKYRRPDVTPLIRIWAESAADGMWRFHVADNGIGIDPAYFDKIFVIFQRLHPVGQYEGTGIGLAMCKRVVLRMGGEISVSSTPGAGACFSFTAHGAGQSVASATATPPVASSKS